MAAESGQTAVINYLLDIGAKFTCNKYGFTFVDIAIKFKQEQSLLAIISHKRSDLMFIFTDFKIKISFMT